LQDRYAQLRVQEEELKRVVDRLEAQRAALEAGGGDEDDEEVAALDGEAKAELTRIRVREVEGLLGKARDKKEEVARHMEATTHLAEALLACAEADGAAVAAAPVYAMIHAHARELQVSTCSSGGRERAGAARIPGGGKVGVVQALARGLPRGRPSDSWEVECYFQGIRVPGENLQVQALSLEFECLVSPVPERRTVWWAERSVAGWWRRLSPPSPGSQADVARGCRCWRGKRRAKSPSSRAR
jgi:hypothetical protein